jgi:hypothetical protein
MVSFIVFLSLPLPLTIFLFSIGFTLLTYDYEATNQGETPLLQAGKYIPSMPNLFIKCSKTSSLEYQLFDD